MTSNDESTTDPTDSKQRERDDLSVNGRRMNKCWIFSVINRISFRTTCLGKIRISTILASGDFYRGKSRLDSTER